MPKAFLIRSRSAFLHTKKENIPEIQDENADRNAQPTAEHFKEGSTSVDYSIPTTSVDQISPAKRDDSRLYAGHGGCYEKSKTQDKNHESSRSTLEIPKYQDSNTNVNQRSRKKSKRTLEHRPNDFADGSVPKKIRKGQPKRNVVYYYETAEETKARESNGSDSRFMRNYTHEKRPYANEYRHYQNHGQTSQSPGTSSDNFYSSVGSKQTGSFAMQNSGDSLEQGKTTLKVTQKNNDVSDKNAGLENVMIVEYHSMRRDRENSHRSNEHKTSETVTQHTSRGYYVPPRSNAVHKSNNGLVASVSTTVPTQASLPPRIHPPAIKQENTRTQEPDTKVVYVPVYPVSQGPNGVIYEAIPNATPIMAKDTVQVKPSQPDSQQRPQRQEQLRPMPQMVQPGQEVVVQRVMPNPPAPQSEQKPRIEYRAYEPRMPQQLTAAPVPGSRPFQPLPKGHVLVQPQTAEGIRMPSSTSYPPRQVPQYQASRPPPPPHQTSHAAAVVPPTLSYHGPQPPSVSAPQPVVSREPIQHYQTGRLGVPISQPYQEIPARQPGQQQSQPPIQHKSYPRDGIVVQAVQPYGPPVNLVPASEPVYQERVNQPRPPPLPSQPQHAEKPALPSPSYPQESANRLLTPRYTPDGVNHEQAFVYAPPPSDFMNSPVYRVPNSEEKTKNDVFYDGRLVNKGGSKKRKSSFPSHTVVQPRKIEEHQEIPSPVGSNPRTPSPKETDLRCNERLVKSPNQSALPLNKSSLVITPPVSPTDGEEESSDVVTVVVRDQGIQASPKDERKSIGHKYYKRPFNHVRSGSYHSESSEEEFLEYDNDSDKKDELEIKDENEDGTYTSDGTLVVRIPYSEHNNNNNSEKKQRSKKGNFRFVCRFCNKGFQWHSHLESHERTHTGEKPFKCPECNRAFCRADGLQCHMLVHNKKRPYKCPYCGKGFNDKIVLEKHIYSHTGVKPFKCEYCGRAFSDSLSIEKHLLVHTGTKPYKCPYCVRSFNDSQMLVRHIRSHTGEKPFKCQHCPMAFSKQSALIIHTRVHTGEKPYQCPHCIKSFSISGNLQRHILIHTGERPYKCSKCPKAFNNPSHLSRHISKLHAPQPGNVKDELKDEIKYEQFHSEQQYCSPQEV